MALAAVAGSQVLPPGTDGPASDCAGQVPIVVGSDRSAQSDLYSAVTLAGVIDTSCIVLAGPRDGEMSADQIARLDAALADPSIGGWVMGGEAAVPEAKIAGRGLKRLNGVDRWHTARLAGAIALDPDGDVAALTAATAPAEGELGGGSVIVDGAEVRLPPGLDASCAGQVPIVVAVDAAAQSDLYSAATLAGVLDTTCYVLAGPRGEPMSAEQMARLAAAETALGTGGWIVGGIAAVPDAKVAGLTLTRIGGADRWETARLIGEAAVAQAAAATSTTTTTERVVQRSSGGGGGSRRSGSGGGGSSRAPTRTPAPAAPAVPAPGTTSTTTTTEPMSTTTTTVSGDTMDTTTTTMPSDMTATTMPGGGGPTTTEPESTTTTSTTVPADPTTTTSSTTSSTTTTTTEPPAMASMFTPLVSVEVPQLLGTSGDNIWSGETFEVSIARASDAHADCSLMSSRTVTFTVQSDGTVADDGSVPATLVGTTAGGATCAYTVTFPAAPTDTPGGDFDWMMSPAAATEATLSAASSADNSATGTYTVGAVSFAPAATITVPAGRDGATFSVGFEGSTANCSGNPSAVTLTYTVPTGGTTAQPDTATNPLLVAYPIGATASTPVCSYTVTFPPTETGGTTLALETVSPAPDAQATGTDQAIAATYALTLMGVSSGETFSCGLQSDGAVFCWGDNNHDQLVVPPLAPGVSFTQVSAGRAHACALRTDGTIACWGDDGDGRTMAPDPPQGATFSAVDAGGEHSCALATDGSIVCWGVNNFGQTDVPDPGSAVTFTQVSTGQAHSCAVKSDQTIVCWGENGFSRVPDRTPPGSFRSVSVGSFYACGTKIDHSVDCWGLPGVGRLNAPAGPFASVSASARANHTCGVRSGGASDGAVACWGSMAENQVAAPSGSFAAVSVATWHSCGLTTDGAVSCWGYGNFNQATSPSGTFDALAGGWYHTCGVTSAGATECWGAGDFMQRAVPTLGAGESFTQISAGTLHTCGVRSGGASDGAVACWGDDDRSDANDGEVSTPPGGAFTAVAAGGRHTCGISSDDATAGQMVCWGADNLGQLTPPDLGPGETFTAVGAGIDHTCALKSDTSVVCWGHNGSGPADGRVSDRPSGATDLFTALAVGDRHACAVRAADSSVACWGDNAAFQSTPPSGAFAALTAGGRHTCGIRAGGADDGTVVCWGSNAAGQSDAPAGTFSALTAGRFHTCGIRTIGAADNTVTCWGAGTAWGLITARPPGS